METENLIFFGREQSLFRGLYWNSWYIYQNTGNPTFYYVLFIYFFQKFSASQRQLGPAEGGMAHSADVMSDDAKVVYMCSNLLHLAPGLRDLSQAEKIINDVFPWAN